MSYGILKRSGVKKYRNWKSPGRNGSRSRKQGRHQAERESNEEESADWNPEITNIPVASSEDFQVHQLPAGSLGVR